MKNPVSIPPLVREMLAKDEEIRRTAEYENVDPDKFPESWFLASEVHLGSGDKKSLVLIGQGPLAGANITQFWIFHATARGYQLILHAGAHDLIVTNRTHGGLRDIEMLAATAVRFHRVVFRFQGERYKIFRDTWDDID